MSNKLRTSSSEEPGESESGLINVPENSSPDSKWSIKEAWNNRWVKVAAVLVVIALVSLAITLPFSAWKWNPKRGSPEDGSRILYDCHPDQGKEDQEMSENCNARGCTWNAGVAGSAPKCSYPPDYENYVVDSVSMPDKHHYQIRLNKTSRGSGFTDDTERVIVNVKGIDDSLLRIRVTDEAEKRWEPPLPVLDIDSSSQPTDPKFNVTADSHGLRITRSNTDTLIFETAWSNLIYSRQFIQVTVNVTSKSLYGLGESMAPHEKSVAELSLPNDREKLFDFQLRHRSI